MKKKRLRGNHRTCYATKHSASYKVNGELSSTLDDGNFEVAKKKTKTKKFSNENQNQQQIEMFFDEFLDLSRRRALSGACHLISRRELFFRVDKCF